MTLAAAPIAPLGGHQLLVFILQILLLLGLAFGLGRLANRIGLPAIVGELLAGVLVGPSLLGWVAPGLSGWLLPRSAEQMHLLDAAGQLGVLLLVGVCGSHLDLRALRRRRLTAARISGAGLLIPLTLGVALGFLFPGSLVPSGVDRGVFALFVGVAMCVTAIPVLAKTLADMRMTHRDVGQLALAAGLIDDAVGWFLLSIVSALATIGLTAGDVSQSVAYLIGFVLFAFVVARPVIRKLLQLADRSEQPGATAAVTVLVVLGGAALTQAMHMEAVFGAFVAGILVGAPGAVNQMKLASLRTVTLWVLAPIFLATAGLRMDLTTLVDGTTALGAAVMLVVAITGKFLGAYIGARTSRLSRWEGLAIGAGMNSRGVVEVIIAMTGLRLGVLNTATYTAVVLVAIVTSVMAPPLLRYAMGRIDQNDHEMLRLAEQEAWSDKVPAVPVATVTTLPRAA
jgi:Kef-type K+ transport system membrane component KefB